MNYGLIKDNKCLNIAVFNENMEDVKAIFIPDVCDDIVPLYEGFGMGDIYKDGMWHKGAPNTPVLSPTELREQAYESMTIKTDGTDLIPWEGKSITVDQANKVYLEYSAEGSPKAIEIQALIVAAKTYIRELYPD